MCPVIVTAGYTIGIAVATIMAYTIGIAAAIAISEAREERRFMKEIHDYLSSITNHS